MFNYNSEVDVWKTGNKKVSDLSLSEIKAYGKELDAIESYVSSVLLNAAIRYSSTKYYVSEIVDRIQDPKNPATHVDARKFLENQASLLTWKIIKGEEDFEDMIVLNGHWD